MIASIPSVRVSVPITVFAVLTVKETPPLLLFSVRLLNCVFAVPEMVFTPTEPLNTIVPDPAASVPLSVKLPWIFIVVPGFKVLALLIMTL